MHSFSVITLTFSLTLLCQLSENAEIGRREEIGDNSIVRRHQGQKSMTDSSSSSEEFSPIKNEKTKTDDKIVPMSPETIIRNLRIEQLKQKILQKLDLKTPPSHSPSQLGHDDQQYKDIINEVIHSKNEQEPHIEPEYKSEDIYILPEETPGHLCPATRSAPYTCLTFKLPEVLMEWRDVKIRGTSLSIHKLISGEDNGLRRVLLGHTHLLTVSEVTYDEHGNLKNLINLNPKHHFNSSSNLEKINVSATIESWLNRTLNSIKKIHKSLTLHIACRNCSKSLFTQLILNATAHNNRPFLRFNAVSKVQERVRSRRNTDCPVGECCRKRLKINFRNIGWDFVKFPEEFEAFYCYGTCYGTNQLRLANNTNAVARLNYLGNRSLDNETIELVPCCVPTRMSNISILHEREDKVMENRPLAIVVASCGCS